MIKKDMYGKIADSIRVLSLDAIQNAGSGHTGMPLGMADIASVFMTDFFNFTPSWINRDRLIISNGHGSMLLYSMLYMMKYLSTTDLMNFRKAFSRTPAHPEFDAITGVEMSTGPLGQGLASAVGFAAAEKMLKSRFGSIIDHYTYVFVGDGCLMEGISHEAASLAGHLGLQNLIVVFDDNNISIDGEINLTSSDNIAKRFESYNWDVFQADGHDFSAIKNAFTQAKASTKPSIICFKTVIGKSVAKKEGLSSAHGGPFSKEEVELMKLSIGWNLEPFVLPEEVSAFMKGVVNKSVDKSELWRKSAEQLGLYDKICAFFKKCPDSDFSESLLELKSQWSKNLPSEATRVSFSKLLELSYSKFPNLVGGSADLSASNGTKSSFSKAISSSDFSGSYVHYGIREHGMAAFMSGLCLYGCFVPYGGTFLVFSDYLRPSVRLASLMKLHVIYIFTHDSIGVGEDGPTHQPVEQIASFRAMPGVYVFRPADAVETLECWQLSLELKSPVIMALSRQGLPSIKRDYSKKNMCSFGAYILRDSNDDPKITLVASGSDVSTAIKVVESLGSHVAIRVISFPSHELFDKCEQSYKDQLFKNDSLKIVIESGTSFGWAKYVGKDCKYFCVDDFGFSGSPDELRKHFGITVDGICDYINESISIE